MKFTDSFDGTIVPVGYNASPAFKQPWQFKQAEQDNVEDKKARIALLSPELREEMKRAISLSDRRTARRPAKTRI